MKKNCTLYTLMLFFSFMAQWGFAQLFPVVSLGGSEKFFNNAYINSEGKLVETKLYDNVNYFSDSIGLVYNYPNRHETEFGYGYVDHTGKELIPMMYDDALGFHNGYALVRWHDSIFIIDKKNERIFINNIFMGGNNYVSEGLIIYKNDGLKGYADLNNKVVIPAEFDKAEPFSDGFAIAMKDDKVIVVERNGKKHETEYIDTDGFKFVNGLLPVQNSGKKWGVINTKLETIVDFKYDNIEEFSDGMAAFQSEKKWGLMNEKGEIILPAVYAEVSDYTQGRVFVMYEDESFALLDESFKVLQSFDANHIFAAGLGFTFGVSTMTLRVTDPNNTDGAYRDLYIDRSGKTIWQGEIYHP